jgi:hypothetical protein
MEDLMKNYWTINEKLKEILAERIKQEGSRNFYPIRTILFADPFVGGLLFEPIVSLKYDSQNNDMIAVTPSGEEISNNLQGCVDGMLELIDVLNGTL